MVVVNVVQVVPSKLCNACPCHSGFRGRCKNSGVAEIVAPVVTFVGIVVELKSPSPFNSAILVANLLQILFM